MLLGLGLVTPTSCIGGILSPMVQFMLLGLGLVTVLDDQLVIRDKGTVQIYTAWFRVGDWIA